MIFVFNILTINKMNNLKHIGVKGAGYFCIVKQFKNEITGDELAIKELKKEHYSNQDFRYRLDREIKLLKDLQGCENIIELIDFGHDKEKEKIWYAMPFANQNLYDFIKKQNNSITKEDRFNIIEQIINAMKYAHSKEILHRDISPNNILIFETNSKLIVKVCDFGLGKDTNSLSFYTNSSASGYGQILYVSPEQRTELKNATYKSDIFSLGKLVYFIFTGRDPDNLKQFELSSLVNKAIEFNPEMRFSDMFEFEKHFIALKELQLNQKTPIEYLTIKEYVDLKDFNWIDLHEILVKGNYVNHVYDDYINPVNDLFLTGKSLSEYYKNIGNNIREFVKTYSDRLNECYTTVKWPFKAMSTFGSVLIRIIKLVDDDETRLICFKQLWYLAFPSDQWNVQKEMIEVFNNKYISTNIETQISEFIISSKSKADLSHFSSVIIPNIIKVSIIKVNELVLIEESEEKDKNKLIDNSFLF